MYVFTFKYQFQMYEIPQKESITLRQQQMNARQQLEDSDLRQGIPLP